MELQAGERTVRPNCWSEAVNQEDENILLWVDLQAQRILVCEPGFRLGASWRIASRVVHGTGASTELEESTNREGHFQKSTRYCVTRQARDLNFHRFEDVVLSKE